MRQRRLTHIAIVAATIAGFLGMTATAAVAGDTNHNGQVDIGDTGYPVWCAQHVVHTYGGIDIGPSGEDWDFGRATKRGVMTYQARAGGLLIDGIVGVNTGHKMRLDVNSLHRLALAEGDEALRIDTSQWLNTCPSAFPVYN